jgi:copper(I)-binding protein
MWSLLLVVAFGGFAVAGCSATAEPESSAPPAANSVTSEDARLDVNRASDGYIYGTLKNNSSAEVKVVGGTAEYASQVIPEKVNILDGESSGEPVSGGIPIPANSEVILEPTNYRIQVKGLNPTPTKGSTVAVNLALSNGTLSQIQTTVE